MYKSVARAHEIYYDEDGGGVKNKIALIFTANKFPRDINGHAIFPPTEHYFAH